jgi:predicted nuclease of predicted toxin-antitoxin system
MRILLDESLPRKLGFLLAGHYVRTVQQIGLSGLDNVKLLAAASVDFDVLITGDQNMESQQNQVYLSMGVIVLLAPSNKLESFLPLVPELLRTLDGFTPNTFTVLPM